MAPLAHQMIRIFVLAAVFILASCDKLSTEMMLSCRFFEEPDRSTRAPISVLINKLQKTITIEKLSVSNVVFTETSIAFEIIEGKREPQKATLNLLTGVLRVEQGPGLRATTEFTCEKMERKL